MLETVHYKICMERCYGDYGSGTNDRKLIYSNGEWMEKEDKERYLRVIEEQAPIIITGTPVIKAKVYEVYLIEFYQSR